MRLFLAIDIPETLQELISELMLPELQQVRWSNSQQLHITLVFIGNATHEQCDEIIESVSELSFSPFSLTLQGIGHFRSGIIWLGVDNNEPLQRLQKALSHKVRSLGIKLEQRKYTPHLTLGRCKHLTPEILQKLTKQALGFSVALEVGAVQLKNSRLKPEGAEYETLGAFLPD